MADTMVVVDRSHWRNESRRLGRTLVPGVLLPWRSYVTGNPLVGKYIERGDRLFLVHAHREELWLAAIYENVTRARRRPGGQFRWESARPNRVRILDVTSLRRRLRFHTGKGLTHKPRSLGNSLQSPRMLTDEDIRLLEVAIRRVGDDPGQRRLISPAAEAEEGRRLSREITVYERDPGLVLACLARDRYTCKACGFKVDAKRFPTLSETLRSRVVQAHHVRPVSNGPRRSALDALVTLCPTCHAVAHAIGATVGVDVIDLSLLRRHFRPSTRT